ncbi:hypothetical protein HS1_002105 [Candidatus Desulfofervidus auxilii]|uniref:Uncharacterized protein n=1 Tax=Desulfofervidus auxilii TaxID=1621989 RepID=A0A7U4QM49_DESA2|nr:hypothetical protein [Candidatus Desulfofervidus auxilii]AMM41891.1 hypothetical protein HS1_002105 [Candidatus Desulfofervidus auxilii]CAD7781316.1 hypothetical protein DMNBHIDG_02608 [Candidatus Methanoperedenaceae archaeon GB37]
MTLQFALCNLHFAIAVRLSCPSGNRLRRLREYKMMDIRKIPNLKNDKAQMSNQAIWIF